MRQLFLYFGVTVSLLGALSPILAESETEQKGVRIGVGASIPGGPTVYVPIDLSPRFRLEPGIQFRLTTWERMDEYKSSVSDVDAGVGVFFIRRVNPVSFYWGGRVGVTYNLRRSEYNNSGNRGSHSLTDIGPFLAPGVGVEHFFLERLSIGLEVMGRTSFSVRSHSTTSQDDPREWRSSSYSTGSAVLMRFYFK